MVTQSDIRDAVRECLTDCLNADLPLSAMASYVSHLRLSDWPEDEIWSVELIVVKVLSRLMQWSDAVEDQPDVAEVTVRHG